MRQLGFEFSTQIAFAYLIFPALLALPIAIVITLALIRRFRARVGRPMQATAGAIQQEPHRPPSNGPVGELQIERIEATRAAAAGATPLVAEAKQRAWQLAAIYAAAAAAYPLLLAAAIMVGVSPAKSELLPFVLVYAAYVLEFAVPVALAPAVVLNRRPRFLALAVLVLVVLVWAWNTSLGYGSIEVLLASAGVPTVATLLLNMRRLRAVGPIVFAATLIVTYGLTAGVAYATLYVVDVSGPWHIVRNDLAGRPWVDAGVYFQWLASLPLGEMIGALSALASDVESVIRADNAQALTDGLWLHFFAIWLGATAVAVVAAWTLIRWMGRSYQTRRASDQMLTIDILMLILGLSMFVALSLYNWTYAVGALAGLVGYKLLASWGLERRGKAAPPPEPLTLLLRVLGFDRRTQRLLDDLGRRWRYLGSIRLTAAPDLAYATIEPYEFFEFLRGRLSRAFIKDEADLESRLSESAALPDPDALFRIEDFFCHEDTWRFTVSRLARDASAVLMDLRGFSRDNKGCIFEIEELIAAVPVHRVVLLVDHSTDVPFLEQTLAGAWQAMPAGSPNLAPGQHRMRILEASANHRRTLAALLDLLCEHPGTAGAGGR